MVKRLTDEQLERLIAYYQQWVDMAGSMSASGLGSAYHIEKAKATCMALIEVRELRAELAALRPPVVCVAVHHGNSTIASILEA